MPTDVLVPPLGTTVDTVRLASWLKKEGDAVRQGEPLFVVETDKATLDVEAPATGTLASVAARPGDEVHALSAIAVILAEGEASTAGTSLQRSEATLAPPLAAAAPRTTLGASAPPGPGRLFVSPRARRLAEANAVPLERLQATGPEGAIIERDVRAYLEQAEAAARPSITPVARRVAEEAGLDWRTLAGSGPRGQVTREDVAAALAEGGHTPRTAEPEAPPAYDLLPMAGVRSVVAERMAESHATSAPVTLTTEADATALVRMRQDLAEDGITISYNDLLALLLARALREHPLLNASLATDGIKVWHSLHLGLAVDTDRGLLVPVLRDVGKKGLAEIARESAALVERARAGRCTPDELAGSTFTLTNLGALGIDAFTPLINLPECAILGIGRIKSRPVMVGKRVRGRQMVWLSLTFDHRLVDGAPAARFLQRVAQLVERPHLLVV